MGDIDFEEQLEQERLARELEEVRQSDTQHQTRTDPDGTVYEWDIEKKAWFPKIDTDFIAQYQMNYGEPQSSEDMADSKTSIDRESYFKHYYEAGQSVMIGSKKKIEVKEDTHEEMVEKLEQLESSIQQGVGTNGDGSTGDYSKEAMKKYTEEEKKQYNEYWSYYYGTEYHDYYGDCMAQFAASEGQNVESDNKGTEMTEDQGQTDEVQGQGDEKKKGKKRKAQEKRPEGWFEVDESHNTNVYVSGLPFDITDEEFKELMNKCGLIMYDPHTRKPKLKLYRDEKGDPKGDGRCCYIKIESVDLALKILDGYDIRGHKIKVERANFHMKGDYDPSKKKKKLTNKEKRKLKEKQAKLFDWRPERPQGTRLKHEKVVILKNLFDPSAFELNPALINTVREDVRAECSNYGDVKMVTVYDRHPDGVVSVTYKDAEEADLCVTSLHQRWFAKRRILAATWDGKTKYEVEESEKEREERLKKWEKFLETGEKDTNEKISGKENISKPSVNETQGNESNLKSAEVDKTDETKSDEKDLKQTKEFQTNDTKADSSTVREVSKESAVEESVQETESETVSSETPVEQEKDVSSSSSES